MIVKIINPLIYTVGNGVNLGLPMENIDNSQIEDIIRKSLLKYSIIADKIEISKSKFKDKDFFKSAQEFLE